MEFVITISGYVVGLPLELLVIAALLHGSYRQFPAVFAYAVVAFLTTVVEMPLALAYYHTHDRHIGYKFVLWYWIDETVMEFLVLAVVMSLMWHATTNARSKRALRTAILVGVIVFAGISLAVHFDAKVPTGRWMTFWTRDLNFGSAVLDMVLWAMLIAKRQKDSRVLMLSAGLGVMFTGEAIGESVRNLESHASALALPGSILVVVTNLVFLYIWWQTLRAPRAIPLASPVKL